MHTEIAYGPTGAKLALMNGQTLKKAFVALPAGAAAVYNSSGLEYYRHADWLGSSRLVSTPSRTVSGDTSYSPFGVPYAGSGTVAASFTGKNQDTASSLYDFPEREYGQVEARWPSPDPLDTGAFNLANPQTLNLYAYVGNMPMGFTDPLGLGPCDSDPNSCVVVQPGGPCTVQSGCTVYVNSEPDCYMPELAGTGFFQQAPCSLVFMTGKDFTWGGLPGAMGVGWFNSGGGGGASGGTAPSPAAPQTPTSAQAATQYCREHGELSFDVPFTHIPVNISLSATLAVVNYSSTNDISLVLPFTVGAGFDVSIDAPPSPLALVSVGSGRNLSGGTFLTSNGPQGVELSVGPSAGSPVTVSLPVANACGLRAGGAH